MAATNGHSLRIDEAQMEQAARVSVSDHSNGIWIAVSEAEDLDATAVLRSPKDSTPAQERLLYNGRRQLSSSDLSSSEPPSANHDTSIAAPYEQPVAPIEHDQEKRLLQKQISQA